VTLPADWTRTDPGGCRTAPKSPALRRYLQLERVADMLDTSRNAACGQLGDTSAGFDAINDAMDPLFRRLTDDERAWLDSRGHLDAPRSLRIFCRTPGHFDVIATGTMLASTRTGHGWRCPTCDEYMATEEM